MSLDPMNIQSILQSIGRTARNHGKVPALYDIVMRSVNKCVYCRTMQCAVIDQVNEQCMAVPASMRFTKLPERDLFEFAETPGCELNADFVRQALAKGDECYAILDGNVLASYGWYSRNPTLTNCPDLVLHFDPIPLWAANQLRARVAHAPPARGGSSLPSAVRSSYFVRRESVRP